MAATEHRGLAEMVCVVEGLLLRTTCTLIDSGFAPEEEEEEEEEEEKEEEEEEEEEDAGGGAAAVTRVCHDTEDRAAIRQLFLRKKAVWLDFPSF